MAINLINQARNLAQRLLDKTDLDERLVQTFKPRTGTIATAGRKFLSQPVPQRAKPVARALESFYNTRNPAVSIPREFASGLSTGQTLGQGRIGAAPQTRGQKWAYGAGTVLGSLNPYSVTSKVVSPIVRATNPILSKAISPVANKFVTGRLASGVANVAQGIPINPLYGQKPLQGAGFDFLTGVAFGPNQFKVPMKGTWGPAVKPSEILSPNVAKRVAAIQDAILRNKQIGFEDVDFLSKSLKKANPKIPKKKKVTENKKSMPIISDVHPVIIT